MITITVDLGSAEEALRLARMFEAYAGTSARVHQDHASTEDRATPGAGDAAYADFVKRGAAPEPIRLYPIPGNGVTTVSLTPDVDARGVPWDERIHSSNRKLTDKGVWQRRRNISDKTVAQVEAELAAPSVPEAASAVVVPPPPETVVSTIDPAVAPVAPVVPSPPAVPADPRANWPKTAKELMPLLVKGMSEGKFTVEHLNAACQQVGVENVNGFNMRPDLIPALVEELNLEVA